MPSGIHTLLPNRNWIAQFFSIDLHTSWFITTGIYRFFSIKFVNLKWIIIKQNYFCQNKNRRCVREMRWHESHSLSYQGLSYFYSWIFIATETVHAVMTFRFEFGLLSVMRTRFSYPKRCEAVYNNIRSFNALIDKVVIFYECQQRHGY